MTPSSIIGILAITAVMYCVCQADPRYAKDPCRYKRCPKGKECRVNEYGRPFCVCSRFCPKIYRPVCGSDGKTYANECLLNVAACENPQIRKVYDGKCGGFFACLRDVSACGRSSVYQKNYNSSCFSLQNTFKKETIDPCAKFICRRPKVCQVDPKSMKPRCVCPRACPYNYQPVCGTDGTTYGNYCSLLVASCNSNWTIKKACNGPCPCKKTWPYGKKY